MIRIRSRLESELAKKTEFRSPYYTEALNYLNKFWKELFAFLDDGELPIDNNLAGVSRGHYNMMVYRNWSQTITSCVLSNQEVVSVVCNKSGIMVRYV